MKSLLAALLAIALLLTCPGMALAEEAPSDGLARLAGLESPPERVIALSASLAEAWLLAGGTLVGITSDALSERDLGLEPDIPVVGTIKEPNAEAIVALEPDLVLMSDELASHAELAALLDTLGIPTCPVALDTLEAYMQAMEAFTALTGRSDLYAQNALAVQTQVDELLVRRDPEAKAPTALFLRAYSSGVKVKARDHIVCDILAHAGVVNIAAEDPTLEELSLEAIVAADPDFIFVVTMGADEAKARASFDGLLASSPAWNGLRAVAENRVIWLPRELFHYKPNSRWAEAYGYLLNILYPETYGAE